MKSFALKLNLALLIILGLSQQSALAFILGSETSEVTITLKANGFIPLSASRSYTNHYRTQIGSTFCSRTIELANIPHAKHVASDSMQQGATHELTGTLEENKVYSSGAAIMGFVRTKLSGTDSYGSKFELYCDAPASHPFVTISLEKVIKGALPGEFSMKVTKVKKQE